jgi:hypothetical protein
MLNIKLRARAAPAKRCVSLQLRLRNTGLTFPIQFRNNLNKNKKEEKVCPNPIDNFCLFLKIGLVYSRVGAGAVVAGAGAIVAGAGAASIFLPRA